MRTSALIPIIILTAGCQPGVIEDHGQSIAETSEGLTGCVGHAASSVPADGNYYLTTFGAGTDSGTMSCGSNTNHGSWYYAASRQRYGCGAHLKVEANGKCVVVQADDYGPDVCVENAAGGPILDASPLVGQALFGSSSAGWSDHFRVHVTEVSGSTPLGPCAGMQPPPTPPATPPSGKCNSSTLAQWVSPGTCVQSQSDGNWYHCAAGAWLAGATGCTRSYAWCHSSTLGKNVPARTCVQSVHDNVWYQCNYDGWDSPVSGGAGPVGTCSTMYAL